MQHLCVDDYHLNPDIPTHTLWHMDYSVKSPQEWCVLQIILSDYFLHDYADAVTNIIIINTRMQVHMKVHTSANTWVQTSMHSFAAVQITAATLLHTHKDPDTQLILNRLLCDFSTARWFAGSQLDPFYIRTTTNLPQGFHGCSAPCCQGCVYLCVRARVCLYTSGCMLGVAANVLADICAPLFVCVCMCSGGRGRSSLRACVSDRKKCSGA